MSLENTASTLEDEEFVDELKPGTKLMLGQYTIEDFLAAGGFGITYLARDSLDRRVVIKECFPGSFCRRQNTSVTPRSRAHQNELKSIVRLFSQEAMSLAKANHPNIVGVHQVFEENNTAYMALDYVHGRDLLEILQEDPDSLEPELVQGYLKKVLGAIGHIHKLGMLHRDISPDNIIINDQGEPLLIDFGAARESTNERVTRMLSALRVVKDGYSPQEFYIAGSDQGPSCDLYSLAASFYHIITRELPPDSQWRLSACAAGDADPYVPLGEKTDQYPARFAKALDKAMAILPRDRMQSAEEWLEHIETGGSVAPEKASKPKAAAAATGEQKKSVMPVLLGGTALAAAAGVGFLYISNTGAEAPNAPLGGEEVAATPDAPGADATPNTVTAAAPATSEPVAPVEAASDSTPTDLAALKPVAPAEPPVDTAPANAAEEPVVQNTLVEFSASDNVAVDVADLPSPTIDGAADTVVPVTFPALPDLLLTSEQRPFGSADIALAALSDARPVIDTTPPAAPLPQAVAAAEEPQQPASDEGTTSAVDFFVAMAKSEPELQAAPRRPQTIVSVPAPVRAAPQQDVIPSIITRSVPVLPFTLSAWQQGVIASVEDDAPGWLTPNSRIVSINGEPVSNNREIQAQLESLATQESTVEVSLGVDAGLNTAVTDRTLRLGTEKQTLLLNGLRFVSREGDEGWTTQVIDAPSSSNFRAGDTLVSYVATWEDLNGPNSLQTILERELANGKSSFSFAVSRNGEIWVEAFNLSSLGN